MREGLFKRYITTFGATLLACTLLLGIALLYFSAKNFTDDKQLILHNTANKAQEIVAEGYYFDGTTEVLKTSVAEGFQVLHDTTGVTICLTDPNGRVRFCTEGESCVHGSTLNQRIFSAILKRGSYSSAGYFEGFFRQRGSYTYGVPVFFGELNTGFIFVSMPIAPLFSYLFDMTVTFLVSAGVMMLVAAVIIFFATRRLITPLSEISSAARRFGSGDFSARVTVTGNDEIANLAGSFNNMADSLTAYESQRRAFVANVSHELRTPMTTIGGYIDGIIDKTIPARDAPHYLGIVSDEVKRLSRLSTSLLNITRIEEGAYVADMHSCNIWDVVIPVMGSLEQRINEKKLEVSPLDDTPHYAMCDVDMLHQIIYNLIENAIKYTPEKGTLTVTAATKNGQTCITVRNTGAGIREEDLKRIFDRFYKADKSRGLDRAGTGLGLYIAKTLCAKMDGTLTANSAYGEWAEFTLCLRAGAPEKNAAKSRSAAQHKAPADPGDKANGRGSWLKFGGKTR